MVVTYEMTPRAAGQAFWHRWRTSGAFRAGVFAFGLIPATFAFAIAASATPRRILPAAVVAIIVELLSPLLFATLMQRLSRRGPRKLMIDSGGVSTEVPSGQWEVPWTDVREIAATSDFIFLLGRGINSVSIPVSAFADDAERDEFVRRARQYLANRD